MKTLYCTRDEDAHSVVCTAKETDSEGRYELQFAEADASFIMTALRDYDKAQRMLRDAFDAAEDESLRES